MEESFDSLENLVIKDKKYRKAKAKKRINLFFIIFIIFLILAVIIYIIIRIIKKIMAKLLVFIELILMKKQ